MQQNRKNAKGDEYFCKALYLRMLFIDYMSAFNTILPSKLITKLSTCILDFLTGRPQVVMEGNNTSAMLIHNTGAPPRCMLSALLYSLFTHDCMARHDSNTIIKFADDTTGRPDYQQRRDSL